MRAHARSRPAAGTAGAADRSIMETMGEYSQHEEKARLRPAPWFRFFVGD